MKNILISTIIRNESRYLNNWHKQIDLLAKKYKGKYNFAVSVFENDSTDDSAQKLMAFDYSNFITHRITSERLKTSYFIGGMNPLRVALLAFARNQSIYGFKFLPSMDFILVVEPDVTYDIDQTELIICDHEEKYGKAIDIITGMSHHPGRPDAIYDSWGTRKTSDVESCDDASNASGLQEMWSTFNCFALYRCKPIIEGYTFGHINKRLNKSDCDTSVICENFRAAGYNKIYWNADFKVAHYCDDKEIPTL